MQPLPQYAVKAWPETLSHL